MSKQHASRYDKNVQHISDAFKNELKQATLPCWMKRTKGKNSDDNFQVMTADGVFDAYNVSAPRKTAKEIVGDFRMKRGDCVFIVGAGLGNTVELLLAACDSYSRVICYEPFWYLTRSMLERHNFSKAIETGKLILCQSTDDVERAIQYVDAALTMNRWLIIKEPYTQHIYNHYLSGAKKGEQLINSIMCNTGTTIGAGKQIAENDLLNIPLLIDKPGVVELKGIHAGKTAVVVSTGPSLAKNILLLTDPGYRGKVVLVAVAQALRVLLGNGITPDYVCTVDFGEVNISHFKGLENCGVPLIAFNRTYSDIFREWRSPIYAVGNGDTTRGCITDLWAGVGNLLQGGSVSHFALSFAHYIGCTKIALIGQDLAYEGSRSHTTGADSAGELSVTEDGEIIWKVNDEKSCIHGTESSLGRAIFVDGFWGKTVMTNSGLYSFMNAFTQQAKVFKCRVFNCTEGGARITGTRRMMLKTFIERHGKDFACEVKHILRVENWRDRVNEAIKLCVSDIENLERARENARHGIDAAKKMIGARQEDLPALFADNHKHTEAAHACARRNPLLEISLYKAAREIATDLYVSSKDIKKNAETLAKRVDRNTHILNCVLDETERLLEKYKIVHGELDVLARDGGLWCKQPFTMPVEYFDKCLEHGNWQLVLASKFGQTDEQIARAQNMRTEFQSAFSNAVADKTDENKLLTVLDFVDMAREIGQAKKDWRNSLRLLRAAEKIMPDHVEVLYGIAACLFLTHKYTESLSYYDIVLTKEGVDKAIVEKERAVVVGLIEEQVES